MKANMDAIFRALADPVRRKILDRLHEKPGMNVNQLSDHFDMTRFGVMKHLKLLEAANLVISRKEWKEKKLYLNAVPIKQIADRWISKFEDQWASRLNKLRTKIEEEK